LPFVISGLSFIPLIGVPFGGVAIIWGIFTRKIGRLKLVLLGAGGIVFTIAIYGGLFFFGFVHRGGVYDRLRAQLAQQQLYTLVQAVEFYRLQYGAYPDTLQQLQATLPKNAFVMVTDPSDFSFTHPRYFYYQRAGADHYYLRGVGADGQPFTPDDIVPEITIAPDSKVGLLLEAPRR
jgi:type II secretory pathway pseudopilin PulG